MGQNAEIGLLGFLSGAGTQMLANIDEEKKSNRERMMAHAQEQKERRMAQFKVTLEGQTRKQELIDMGALNDDGSSNESFWNAMEATPNERAVFGSSADAVRGFAVKRREAEEKKLLADDKNTYDHVTVPGVGLFSQQQWRDAVDQGDTLTPDKVIAPSKTGGSNALTNTVLKSAWSEVIGNAEKGVNNRKPSGDELAQLGIGVGAKAGQRASDAARNRRASTVSIGRATSAQRDALLKYFETSLAPEVLNTAHEGFYTSLREGDPLEAPSSRDLQRDIRKAAEEHVGMLNSTIQDLTRKFHKAYPSPLGLENAEMDKLIREFLATKDGLDLNDKNMPDSWKELDQLLVNTIMDNYNKLMESKG